MRWRLTPGLVCLLAWALAGCALLRPVKKPADLYSPTEIEDLLRRRAAAWSTYQAKLQIRTESAKGVFRMGALVLSDQSGRLRLEVLSPTGHTLGALVAGDGGAVLWLPNDKAVFKAVRSELLVKHFLGAALPLEVLSMGLTATIPETIMNSWRMSREQEGWLSQGRHPGGGFDITWRFRDTPPALAAVSVAAGDWNCHVAYDPPAALDASQTPRKVQFTAPEWRMEVSVKQIQPTPEAQPAAFQLPVPEGARIVDLDQA